MCTPTPNQDLTPAGDPFPSADALTEGGPSFSLQALRDIVHERYRSCDTLVKHDGVIALVPRSQRLVRDPEFNQFVDDLRQRFPDKQFLVAESAFRYLRSKPLFGSDKPEEHITNSEQALRILRRIGASLPSGQANGSTYRIPATAQGSRRSFESEESFTIDSNYKTPDKDDAISIRESSEGVILRVHIADADCFVPEGSKFDLRAQHLGASSYGKSFIRPMLPASLSFNGASLVPGHLRPTRTMSVAFDKDFRLQDVSFEAGLIRSRAEYSNDYVTETLVQGKSCPHRKQFALAYELAKALAAGRAESQGLVLDYDDIGGFIVQEAMILYNHQQALDLQKRGVKAPYRVNPGPTPEMIQRLHTRLADAGFSDLPADTSIQLLYRAAHEQADTPRRLRQLNGYFQDIMVASKYSVDPSPHTPLGVSVYTHATSPIRRYSDLLVQRITSGRYTEARAPGLSHLVAHLNEAIPAREDDGILIRECEKVWKRLSRRATDDAAQVLAIRKSGIEIYSPETRSIGALDCDYYPVPGDKNAAIVKLFGERIPVQAGQKVSVALHGYRRDIGRFTWRLTSAPIAHEAE